MNDAVQETSSAGAGKFRETLDLDVHAIAELQVWGDIDGVGRGITGTAF